MALARSDQILMFRYVTQKATTGWCVVVPRPDACFAVNSCSARISPEFRGRSFEK